MSGRGGKKPLRVSAAGAIDAEVNYPAVSGCEFDSSRKFYVELPRRQEFCDARCPDPRAAEKTNSGFLASLAALRGAPPPTPIVPRAAYESCGKFMILFKNVRVNGLLDEGKIFEGQRWHHSRNDASEAVI